MKKIIVILSLFLPPLLVSIFVKFPIFSFALGSTDAWISFWGCYLGSLIGAVTVYLVTNLQIKEQRKIQLESIREEHKNALKREMQQYHFRNQVNKIEEFYQLIEETMDSLTKCTNEFTGFITLNHILYGGIDEYTKEQEIEFNSKIKQYRNEYHNWFLKINGLIFKMDRVSLYVEDTSDYVKKIIVLLNKFADEIKNGYMDKNSFKKYLTQPNQPALSQYLDQFLYLISQLKFNVLEPKLEAKITEMNSVSK